MVKLAVLTFNPFQENTYVVSDDTRQCIVVDPGNSTEAENQALANYLDQNGLTPVAVVATHAHVDHIAGADFLVHRYGIPFALHSDDLPLLEKAQAQGALFGFPIEAVPSPQIDLKTLPGFAFGATTLRIIHTPGHSPGHVSLFVEGENLLLSGDTLFRESIGRTDLPGGDYHALMNSILKQILPLGDTVQVHPGHGPKTTLGHESLYNPFITEVLNHETRY